MPKATKKGPMEARVMGRPPGSSNRNSLTVRMALNKMGYDVVTEYIKCIQAMDDPYQKAEHLHKFMAYMYPKLKEIEVTPSQILEMEQADIMAIKPADISTEQLLAQVESKDDDKS